MQLNSSQALLFFAMLWVVILIWPKLAKFICFVLGRHAHALSGLYKHVWRGLREYSDRHGDAGTSHAEVCTCSPENFGDCQYCAERRLTRGLRMTVKGGL